MSDGHYDAPAYCAICDRPIATGPICDGCSHDNDDDLDELDLDARYHVTYDEYYILVACDRPSCHRKHIRLHPDDEGDHQ
jgi:hypothetical protein